MAKIKVFFFKIGRCIKVFTWNIRNSYNKLIERISAVFLKFFHIITFKRSREDKILKRHYDLKQHLGIKENDFDVTLDLDIIKTKVLLSNQIKNEEEQSEKYFLELPLERKKEILVKEKEVKKGIKLDNQEKKQEIASLRILEKAELKKKRVLNKELRKFQKQENKALLQIRKQEIAQYKKKINEVAKTNKKERQSLYQELAKYLVSEKLDRAKKIAIIPEEHLKKENELKIKLAELKAQIEKAIYDLIDVTFANKLSYLKYINKCIPLDDKKREFKERVTGDSKAVLKGVLYLLPILILLGIFSFYPIFNALRLVIYEGYNEVDGSITGYTALGNFISVLQDANFIVPSSHTGSSAMLNTLLITVLTVPLTIIIGLFIAVLLNSIKPLQGAFQTIFFLPYVTNSLAVGLVFSYMFQKDGGLFNQFLSLFGITGGAWVGVGASYWKAMFVLVLYTIWNGLAFKIMLFLSAIQGIDKQYYQAAAIDATPKFKQFRKITVPLISPVILYTLITSVIGSFKTYSSVIAIFGNTGQPAGATYNLKTIVFYIYDFVSTTGKMSEASAASIILFVIILILTLVQMKASKKRVHY